MKAPAFSLPDQNGRIVTLDSLRGKKVVLYFYPKAETPGCTVQACGLRDNYGELKAKGVTIIGISPDEVADLKRFAQKHVLPFPLLSDVHTKVAQAYGVWGQKQFMGKTFMGVLRTTFLIDEQGIIVKRYDNVKPETHAEMIIDDVHGVKTSPTGAVVVHSLEDSKPIAKASRSVKSAKPIAKPVVKKKKTVVKVKVAAKKSAKKVVKKATKVVKRVAKKAAKKTVKKVKRTAAKKKK